MKSRIEYHVFAEFTDSYCGKRIAITLSEKQAKKVGDMIAASGLVNAVWYRLKERRPDTKPWRRGRM